ncbi:radical SAM protein [Planobispora longispora]|uniref:radical SAM protein n=1 Tax=Planobispora longispora TaxID=28887 RepID=UPI0019410976|nr:radical SAM protein [Planobispora longispora]
MARLRAGHLTPEGTLTPSAARRLAEMGLFRTSRPKTYSLTVLTSTDCNLGCGYCFQNVDQDPTGGSRPPRISHARLTSDTITDILEFTRRRMAAAGMEALHILLFGGEPLLNPRGCRELLSRAAGHGLASASMISNGTLLTPLLAGQLVDLGLRSVQITFDGDAVTHDHIRVRRSGGGTFEGIIRNIARVSETTPLGWGLRINVSHLNHAGIDSLIDTLADRLDPSRCAVQFAWVGDVGVGYANEMRHTAGLAERFFRWRRHALERGFGVGRPRAHLPCGTCSHADGLYGAVVSADGTLSSCWETAGKPGWQVGTVVDGYLPSGQTENIWVSCDDQNHYSDDDQAVTAFNDAADAAFLDYLAETGRLRT